VQAETCCLLELHPQLADGESNAKKIGTTNVFVLGRGRWMLFNRERRFCSRNKKSPVGLDLFEKRDLAMLHHHLDFR
jgi:hypothetical protein